MSVSLQLSGALLLGIIIPTELKDLSVVTQINRTARQLAIDCVVGGALLFGAFFPAYAETISPTLIGHYSNQVWSKGEDPHALSGYSLDLYRQGDLVFGRLGIAVGSSEPIPAKLYDISFNQKARTISFKANYSEGRRVGKDIPFEKRDAKVVLSFSGKLSPRGVQGEFVRQDGYPPHEVTGKEKSLLRKQKDRFVPQSFEEWSQMFGD